MVKIAHKGFNLSVFSRVSTGIFCCEDIPWSCIYYTYLYDHGVSQLKWLPVKQVTLLCHETPFFWGKGPCVQPQTQEVNNCKWHNDFEKEIWSFCSKTHRVPLDPRTMKNEGFTPQNMLVIAPKNEGCGFPWYSKFSQLRPCDFFQHEGIEGWESLKSTRNEHEHYHWLLVLWCLHTNII